MRDKEGENTATTFGLILLIILISFVVSGATFYNLDSDRDALEACNSKLERDRYCVMVAVPSEYRLTLNKEKINE